jgi:hypothetical protein
LRRSIEEVRHSRVAGEQPADFCPAHSAALSVNQADLAKPEAVRFVEVVRDDALDVARKERVQVERVLDRNLLQERTANGRSIPRTSVGSELDSQVIGALAADGVGRIG